MNYIPSHILGVRVLREVVVYLEDPTTGTPFGSDPEVSFLKGFKNCSRWHQSLTGLREHCYARRLLTKASTEEKGLNNQRNLFLVLAIAALDFKISKGIWLRYLAERANLDGLSGLKMLKELYTISDASVKTDTIKFAPVAGIPFDPSEFNTSTLTGLGGLKLCWTDCSQEHLTISLDSKIPRLFSCPSWLAW